MFLSFNHLVVSLILFKCSEVISIGRCFPKGFHFGVSTSAYQIEGAWNEDGKGENVWDHITHADPNFINDGTNADFACDSYHKLEDDIAILKYLKVDTYRLSISWSRILPNGFINKVNQEGVNYYRKLIKALKAARIEPMVTLHHWDLPQALRGMGAWTNPEIIDLFADYARLAFELFGNDVKIWSTFNEPLTLCVNHIDTLVNDSSLSGIAEYLCAHNILKSHAKVYHIYNDEFKAKQGGKISIVLNIEWLEPQDDTTENIEAAERGRVFTFGWFANPIFLGDYSEIMKEAVLERSLKEGFNYSRLPEFTEEEILYIKGTHDYLGLNEYTSSLTRKFRAPIGSTSFLKDVGIMVSKDPKWPTSGADWLKVEPTGLRKSLRWAWEKYSPGEIIVTENGYADKGEIFDIKRIDYFTSYLSNVLDAIYIDKVNVTGYMAWSLMDNFEWQDGYSVKFGFYHINFKDPLRTRIPKLSALFYRKLSLSHCL